MIRSIAAIVVGFMTPAILVTITDALMMQLAPQWFPNVYEGAEPTSTGLVVNLLYGTVFAVLGGWLMARIAGHDIRRHLTWLLVVLVAFGGLSAYMSRDLLPLWYGAMLVVLGAAGYYAGAMLYLRGAPEAA
jgi:hypothetical protein